MSVDNISDERVQVCMSPECREEKRYIAEVLLHDFLGWNISFDERSDIEGIEIYFPNQKGRLKICEGFFAHACDQWLDDSTLPGSKPRWCKDEALTSIIEEQSIPVFYGDAHKDGSWWKLEDGTGELALDVFGNSFFFLSRYEEAVSDDCDEHGRFPSSASAASRWNVLNRPVVNEYLEILWGCAKQIWPRIKRKERQFRTLPSHDIDWPYLFIGVPAVSACRNSLRGIKRGKLNDVVTWSWQYMLYRLGRYEADPYNTIPWILDQSDKRDLKSSFYYIPQQTHLDLDPQDYLGHPHVMAQWQMILERCHEIGVHPGYETFESSEAIAEAADRIRKALNKLGHADDLFGGRQHFLRWKTPETARYWESASLSYDSTLGFADKPGFRCGVCFEYQLYDVVARKSLKLRERPLIVMECSVIDQQYMGLGLGTAALNVMASLKDTCQKYHGDFTILWHNHRLIEAEEQELYTNLLDH